MVRPVTGTELRNLRVSSWRREIKAKAIEYLGGKCKLCGYDRCNDALVFHHRDPRAKEFRLSKYSVGWDKMMKELGKCDLLCANCHFEVHAEWKRKETEEHDRIVAKYKRAEMVEVRCAQCSKPKMIWPSRVTRSRRFFCSVACRGLSARRPKTKRERRLRTSATYPDDSVLRKRVWEIPVVQLASDLGVSSVSVKKYCARRGIPTPPRGYWSGR